MCPPKGTYAVAALGFGQIQASWSLLILFAFYVALVRACADSSPGGGHRRPLAAGGAAAHACRRFTAAPSFTHSSPPSPLQWALVYAAIRWGVANIRPATAGTPAARCKEASPEIGPTTNGAAAKVSAAKLSTDGSEQEAPVGGA